MEMQNRKQSAVSFQEPPQEPHADSSAFGLRRRALKTRKTLVELAGLKLTRVLILSAVLVGITNSLSYIFRINYWQPGNYEDALLVYCYQHEPQERDVLFVGSSHTLRGILSKTIEEELQQCTGRTVKVFNIGQRGAHVFTDYVVVRDLLASGKKPEVMAVEVSPDSLNFQNKLKRKTLKYYFSQSDLVKFVPLMRSQKDFYSLLAGMFRGLGSLIDFAVDNPRGTERAELLAAILANGGGYLYMAPEDPYKTIALPEDEWEQKQVKRKMDLQKSRRKKYEINEHTLRAINEIIEMTQKRGVKLVFYSMPVMQEFVNTYTTDNYITFRNHVKDITTEKGIRYYDLNTKPLGLVATDFRDFDHLNVHGAEKVSRQIARDLLPEYFPPKPEKALASRG